LLEVLLATGILLGCVIVLSELARIGSRSASAAQDLAQAQLLCQTRLNELLAGIAPLEQVHAASIDGTSGWVVSVDLEPLESRGLLAVRVTVSQDAPQRPHPAHCTLVRWIRDPQRPLAVSSASDSPSAPLAAPSFGGGTRR
jgi:hypothetical protein